MIDSKTAEQISPFIELGKVFLAGLIGGLVAPYFGSVFAMRRFRQEEAWKQKRSAYDVIVVELGRQKANADELLLYYAAKGNLGGRYIKPESTTSLNQILLADDYIISTAAAKALKAFIKFTDPPFDTEIDEAEALLSKVDETLAVVRAEASRDLGLKIRWWQIWK